VDHRGCQDVVYTDGFRGAECLACRKRRGPFFFNLGKANDKENGELS